MATQRTTHDAALCTLLVDDPRGAICGPPPATIPTRTAGPKARPNSCCSLSSGRIREKARKMIGRAGYTLFQSIGYEDVTGIEQGGLQGAESGL